MAAAVRGWSVIRAERPRTNAAGREIAIQAAVAAPDSHRLRPKSPNWRAVKVNPPEGVAPWAKQLPKRATAGQRIVNAKIAQQIGMSMFRKRNWNHRIRISRTASSVGKAWAAPATGTSSAAASALPLCLNDRHTRMSLVHG